MSYPSTTGDPNLCDQNRMGSDRHVMSDLNQVVDFCSLSNDRLSKCSSIDRDICSQLDIVLDRDSAKLGDFVMPPLVLDIAESVASDDRPAVNDHSGSDRTPLRDDDIGIDERVVADKYIGIERHASANRDPVSQGDSRPD